MNPEYINAVYGILGSIIGAAAGYGVLKQKVDHLMEEKNDYVQKEVFDATLDPIRQSLSSLGTDVKEILKRLSYREE